MSNSSHVLLIAERDDAEAGLVAESLDAHGAEVFWVDTAEFPGWLRSRDGEIGLALVRSVYRRSPALFGVDDGMSTPERRFALMEALQGMGGALMALGCR